MDIKLIKLVTGEEIAAEIVSDDGDTVTVKNCIAVVLNPSREGFSYGFLPWGGLSPSNKSINWSKIVYAAEAGDDLRNNYNSMFGGIVTPPQQLIT